MRESGGLLLSAHKEAAMGEWSPLEEDVLLKGVLTVIVRRPDGSPRAGERIVIRGCGSV